MGHWRYSWTRSDQHCVIKSTNDLTEPVIKLKLSDINWKLLREQGKHPQSNPIEESNWGLPCRNAGSQANREYSRLYIAYSAMYHLATSFPGLSFVLMDWKWVSSIRWSSSLTQFIMELIHFQVHEDERETWK
jgi:hypothetical protein